MMLKDLKDAPIHQKLGLTQGELCLTQAKTCLTQAKFCPNSAKKSPNSNFRRVVVSARQKSAEKNPEFIRYSFAANLEIGFYKKWVDISIWPGTLQMESFEFGLMNLL